LRACAVFAMNNYPKSRSRASQSW